MANFFDGVITSELKQLFKDGVDTLLNPDNSITSRCLLIYPSTKKTNSSGPNTVGQTSNFHHITGQPIPYHGVGHPAQDGENSQFVEVTEEVNMILVWNQRRWVDLSSVDIQEIKVPENYVQTMCHIDLLPKLQQAKEAIFDLDNEMYNRLKFVRYSDPENLGLFGKYYALTMWERASA